MTSSASNHVTGLENGSESGWWTHTVPEGSGSGSSSSTSWGSPWDHSYDTTVSYPGFWEGHYYGRDYGGGSGEEDYIAYVGDAFSDGSSSGSSSGTLFPFAYGDEELLFGQSEGGGQQGVPLGTDAKSTGEMEPPGAEKSRKPGAMPSAIPLPACGRVASEQAVGRDPSADRPGAEESGQAVVMAEGQGGSDQEDGNWWNSSGWWWLNPWSYPVLRAPINYYTGYYDALDRAKELDVARQARDPNRILRAGDIPSLTQGVSQWEAAARAESEIKRFGRDRIADAAYIAGGEIIGMAGAGGFADDAAKAAASGRTGRTFGELIKDVTSNPSKWQVVKKEMVASTNIRNKGGWSIQELLRNAETGEEIVRHTLLRPDGTLFEVPHFRPFWK